MNASNRSKIRQRDQRGFILVSVVMFVLILTVLGSSLLTHGPLENSAITNRVDNEQAFWYADAGQSRSLTALGNSGDLGLANNTALRPASLPLSKAPYTLVAQRSTSIIVTDSATTGRLNVVTNPGAVVVISTGKSGPQARTIQRVYNVALNPMADMRNLLNFTGSFSAKKDQTFIGKIIVPNATESLLVLATGVPKDSIVIRPMPVPNYGAFITSKIAAGSNAVTGAMFASSSAASPLVLGKNNNGVYYSSSGFNYPTGQVGYAEIWGTVYVLANGPISFGKDLVLTKGNSSAALIIISNSAGGTALDFAKQPNNGGIPLIMMTNGDVAFKKGTNESITNTSIFGRNISMDKDQTWAYNHSVMDPVLNALIDGGGIPIPGGQSNLALFTPQPGKWAELIVPRLN